MRFITGLGNIPPVRRWETGAPVVVRRPGGGSLPMPTARPITGNAFRAAGYGMAPPANRGEPVSALHGLGDDDCETTVRFLREQIAQRLDRVSPGIKVTAESILKQTEGTFTQCSFRKDLLQNIHDAVINDIRAGAGSTPKTAKDIDTLTPVTTPPLISALGLRDTRGTFWENFYSNGKLTPVGIGTIVAGGLLVAAIATGSAGAILGRSR